jgi:hypothetical protein
MKRMTKKEGNAESSTALSNTKGVREAEGDPSQRSSGTTPEGGSIKDEEEREEEKGTAQRH